jgi:hypothetical protein
LGKDPGDNESSSIFLLKMVGTAFGFNYRFLLRPNDEYSAKSFSKHSGTK